MKQFEVLDVSGDAGIRAFGKTFEELFINAAEGMYSLITDTKKIAAKEELKIELKGHSIENLFIAWLNELIFYFDTYGYIGREIHINRLLHNAGESESTESFFLEASLKGNTFDPEKHESYLLIKAATYHKLKIEKTGEMWIADVIFDI